MNNGRFAVALHILTVLTEMKEDILTSEWIAGSININPALVRKEIGNLRKHGLVESREGKNGGYMLAKPAAKIMLSDIYNAVKQEYILGHTKNSPNPECRVGKQINRHLDNLYREIDDDLVEKLSRKTLADFSGQFE